MPSTKVPNTVVSVGGGATPPASGGSALSGALTAHITDPVGAHAATAISTTALSAWADATTNPAADVQTQLAKVVTDLISAAGATGAGKVYKGVSPAWEDGSTIAAGDLNTWANAIISTLANSTPGNSGAEKIGSMGYSNVFGPWTTSDEDVSTNLQDVLSAVNYGLYSYLVVNAGNSPFAIGSSFYTLFFVDSTSGQRTLTLPQTPANYRGMRWYVYDINGTSETYWIHIDRYSGSTYKINGRTGISSDIYVRGTYGMWVVTCDGTDFYVQECLRPKSDPYTVTSSPYELDSRGFEDEELIVECFVIPITITLPQYPQLHTGQRWYLYDRSGSTETNNLTIQRHGSGTYSINGYLTSLTVANNYGQWVVTCDGSNFYVQECKAPINDPIVLNAGNSPYTLDSSNRQDYEVFTVTSAARTVVLPQYPARHKGQQWVVHDQTGTSETYNININRYAGATYAVNGLSGTGGTATYLSSNYGRWVITCDGTNFFVN